MPDAQVQPHRFPYPTVNENSSPIYTLQITEPNGQFVFTPLRFESGVEHRFMDTISSESIPPKSSLTATCPNAVLTLTSVRIHAVIGHQLQLLGETMLCVQSESGVSIPIRFLVSTHSPSILGLRVMRLLQGSITLHTNNDMPITSHLQHLIVQCSVIVGIMKVPSVRMEVDDEPIFLKHRVLPYGQREGVLKAVQKMEQDGVISKAKSSAWAMKGDDQAEGDHMSTPNIQARSCNIQSPNCIVTLVGAYRAPLSDEEVDGDYLTRVSKHAERLVIMGDFNYPEKTSGLDDSAIPGAAR
ncbi:unnamed protein product [Echinostoma caproni]|uniref:Endo/exonuclease/phosphatase domain-containing protein n=1 Tax=Echinostoma caproni TaxID=27848 RepID=A0A183BCF1_9TREM|nr:unnamed protein product [Echinostoma caproni]